MTDRELDAYLAEHLFGDADLADAIKYAAHYIPNGPNAFSSTGDGMLAVQEAMRERGFESKSGISIEQHGWQRWASFFDGEHDGRRGEAEAATLPRAVALAAKAALEASIPSQVIDA